MSPQAQASNHPSVAAMSKRFVFKNLWRGNLVLHGSIGTGTPPITLKPGEETILTGHECSSLYVHAIKAFRDCKPPRLSMHDYEDSAKDQGHVHQVADQGLSGDSGGEEIELKDDADPIVEAAQLKAEVKALEAEYKSKDTTLDRKQEIKEEIRDKRKLLKTLK